MFKILEVQEKLERIDTLIRLKATGSPIHLANRLNISKSTLYEYINLLKELGADICYDTTLQTYCYKNEVKIRLLKIDRCDDAGLENIKGGKKYVEILFSPEISD